MKNIIKSTGYTGGGKNQHLTNAKKNKNDEFYTQLTDIEKELKHYRHYFLNKIVYCNCDDPYESNFVKFFLLKFNEFGLKKLIATSYVGSPILGQELTDFYNECQKKIIFSNRKAYKLEITHITGNLDLPNIQKVLKNKITHLNGDGDFRSDEAIELLKEADIVVTNPPFSLFREYLNQLIKYEKKFIIIGNQNAIKYKEIFPLIMDKKIWYGASIHSGDRKFNVPNSYPLNASGCGIDDKGRKFIKVKGIRWFTNVDYESRHEPLKLVKKYTPDKYPKYDTYDAINVNKYSDIPCDYDGVIGVPITFLDFYCPEQFEIVGTLNHGSDHIFDLAKPIISGKELYTRIAIRLIKREDNYNGSQTYKDQSERPYKRVS